MSTDPNAPEDFAELPASDGRVTVLPIEEELKGAYLTYAYSVIVSRALPDVRDGLKPSQRRILVAMNDLNLGPNARRMKCAKISGDTSGNYHPHGEAVIYPTLVRMAQDWNMRYVLIDKQGNFGTIAGMPPAAMRYTEARLSTAAALLLDDLDQDTVDFVPNYDGRQTEPTVLPAKFPNLLVNGATGIAVGMTSSVPPHNLSEVCHAVMKVIDDPDVTVDELMEILPGPDFPTGGIICGTAGIRRAYHTGLGSVVVRARAEIDESEKRKRIIISEIPYQQTRDRIAERIAELVNTEKIKGIHEIRDWSTLEEPVKLVVELKKDVDPELVLNQLYQFSPLQDTYSLTMRVLVDGKPQLLSIKELLQEFLRHRLNVIRRRTQYQLDRARKRKHTVEGLLLAFANIDEIIRIIRTSKTQAEAKTRLMGVAAPAAMMERALGDEGYTAFTAERGLASEYTLTSVQCDAILRMTLGQLVNLEQDRLSNEHRDLLATITECLRILSDDRNILEIIREDLIAIEKKFRDPRRTELTGAEVGDIDFEDLIAEEMMAVTISTRGYIKRTPSRQYRAQRRGGKGLTGAKSDEEDPIEHLFVASTHDYLLFFTNFGKVYWQKVYGVPQQSREAKGRAIVNLLQLQPEERIANCLAVRDFSEADRYLLMATRNGLVKKTPLAAYGRPLKGGIIAIKLREGDELIQVAVTANTDEVVLSTAKGMAIRFPAHNARAMGRNTSGVKGIGLSKGDHLVGMVIADPDATLLTVCEKGYGKRTPFGPNDPLAVPELENGDLEGEEGLETAPEAEAAVEPVEPADAEGEAEEGEDAGNSSRRYRTQRRGGKGVRDIKTTARNGDVVCAVAVRDTDEVLMMSAKGKMQRVAVSEISVLGRNTQGVRIMNVEGEDSLAAIVRVPEGEGPLEDPNAEAPVSPFAPTADAPTAEGTSPAAEGDGEPTGEADSAPGGE